MFNKLKQIKNLRSQAKTIQSMLAKETIVEETRGITITMDGNLEVKELKITDAAKNNLEQNMQSAINDVIKKAQRVMAKKMQEMGQMPGLSDLMK